MKTNSTWYLPIATIGICLCGLTWSNGFSKSREFPSLKSSFGASVKSASDVKPASVTFPETNTSTVTANDSNAIQLCSYTAPDGCPTCGKFNGCGCNHATEQLSFSGRNDEPQKYVLGVDQFTKGHRGKEPAWRDAQQVPWESFGYGEYIGPHRTPQVAEYQLRIGDTLDFVFLLTRNIQGAPYKIFVGDLIQITSGGDASLNQTNVLVLPDGTISLPFIGTVNAAGKNLNQLSAELNERYGSRLVRDPTITVQVIKGDMPLNDLRDAVDARAGQGGQSREVEVSPDGTIQLPLIGAVPAIGLTLDEIATEVNARYQMRVNGISVTPILVRMAPRSVYLLGEVKRPGKIEIKGATTLMQALAMAENYQNGANLRQVIVFRRDQDYRLVATKLDIAGAMYGKQPHPADEIWLRDSDIILVPPTPILRLSRAVELYLTRTVYSIFPQQFQLQFNFDNFRTF